MRPRATLSEAAREASFVLTVTRGGYVGQYRLCAQGTPETGAIGGWPWLRSTRMPAERAMHRISASWHGFAYKRPFHHPQHTIDRINFVGW